MKPAYLGGIVLFAVFAAIGIYYLIPGINHVFADPPKEQHIKHALVFFVLAVASVIGARFVANSSPQTR